MKRTVPVLFLATALALARVIVVPDSAPTIQAGLNSAASGDTVLVMPGDYKENLVWPGTDGMQMLSAAGPESTVVNGQYAGPCLTLGSGSLTRATLVRGFTFTQGLGSGGGAAGISCAGSASIVGNRVTRCNGVGVYLSSYGASFNPLVIGNEIDGCFKEIPNYNYGCGMYIRAEATALPEICCNYIHHDTLRNSSRNYGGGIFCDANGLICQNIIEANVLHSDTGSSCRAYGAGIFVDMECQPLIFSNLIINNRCETDAWKYGAGIRLYSGAKPVIVNNTIAGNVCTGPHMWSNGGGLYSDMRCTSYVKNNIFADNQATSGSGIFNYTSSQPGLVVSLCNDYYNNSLEGCAMGPGDITADPLFVSGFARDFLLSQIGSGQPRTSPCVDAGDTLAMTQPINLDSLLRSWTTRTDSGFDLGLLDMGYHYPGGIMVGIAEGLRSRVSAHGTVAPNPFRASTAIRYSLTAASDVSLAIYNVAGRRVRAIALGHFEPGVHSARWDGKDDAGHRVASGAYVCRLRAGADDVSLLVTLTD